MHRLGTAPAQPGRAPPHGAHAACTRGRPAPPLQVCCLDPTPRVFASRWRSRSIRGQVGTPRPPGANDAALFCCRTPRARDMQPLPLEAPQRPIGDRACLGCEGRALGRGLGQNSARRAGIGGRIHLHPCLMAMAVLHLPPPSAEEICQAPLRVEQESTGLPMHRGSFRGKTNKPSVFFVSRLDVGWRGKSAFRLRGGGGIGPRKLGVNGQVAMSALGSGHGLRNLIRAPWPGLRHSAARLHAVNGAVSEGAQRGIWCT